MEGCIVDKTRNFLGDTGKKLNTTAGYTISVTSATETMDRRSGQIILPCEVEGSSSELEVYPDPNTPNIYDVTRESIQVAPYVCKLAKREDKNGNEETS